MNGLIRFALIVCVALGVLGASVQLWAASTNKHRPVNHEEIEKTLSEWGLTLDENLTWEQIQIRKREILHKLNAKKNLHKNADDLELKKRWTKINLDWDFLEKSVRRNHVGKSPLEAAQAAGGRRPKPSPAAPGSGSQQHAENLYEFTVRSGQGPSTETKAYLVNYHPATEEQLRRYRPSTLRNEMDELCRKDPKSLKKKVLDFGVEVLTFNTAVMAEALLHGGSDPAALMHFYDESIKDPVAHISFLAFVLANRGALQFFKNIGWDLDPCTEYEKSKKLGPNGKPANPNFDIRKLKATKFQRVFKVFAPAMGMGTGLFASSLTTEILKDEDLKLCALSMIGKADKKSQEVIDACDHAYDNWTATNKVRQYAPELLANIVMVGVQGITNRFVVQPVIVGVVPKVAARVRAGLTGIENIAAAKKAHGAAQSTVLMWRSLSLFAAGSWAVTPPVLKFTILNVGNLVFFMEGMDFILSPFKRPYDYAIKSWDLKSAMDNIQEEIKRTEASNWVWTSKVDYQCLTDPLLWINPTNWAWLWLNQKPLLSQDPAPFTKCFSLPVELLIRKHAYMMTQWRQFLLEEAIVAHDQWKDYVLSFQTMYTSAYGFYKWFTDLVAEQNENTRMNNGKVNPLYRKTPLNGVFLMARGENGKDKPNGSSDGVRKAITQAIEYIDLLLDKNPDFLLIGHDDKENLKTIRRALALYDSTRSIEEFIEPNSVLAKALKKNPGDRDQATIDMIRVDAIERGVRLLNRILSRSFRWRDRAYVFRSDEYVKVAKRNPFMTLRMLLGDPEPMPEGVAALRAREFDSSMFNQDMIKDHPKSYGALATTPLMTDYLVASMLCGPHADPSFDVKLKTHYKNNTSLFARGLRSLLGKTPKAEDLSAEQRRTVELYAEKAKRPEPSWSSDTENLTLVKQIDMIRATFVPPRLVSNLGFEICKSFPKGIQLDKRYTYNIHEGQWEINGKLYHGYLDVAKHHLKPEIISPESGESNFDAWWTANVDPAVKQTVKAFDTKFKEILTEKFFPVIRSDARASLLDQAGIYLGWLKKAHLSRFKAQEKVTEREKIESKIKTLTLLLEKMTALFDREEITDQQLVALEKLLDIETSSGYTEAVTGDIDKLTPGGLHKRIKTAYDAAETKYADTVKELTELVQLAALAKLSKTESRADQSRIRIMNQVLEAIQGLTSEIRLYMEIINTLHVDNLERESEEERASEGEKAEDIFDF